MLTWSWNVLVAVVTRSCGDEGVAVVKGYDRWQGTMRLRKKDGTR